MAMSEFMIEKKTLFLLSQVNSKKENSFYQTNEIKVYMDSVPKHAAHHCVLNHYFDTLNVKFNYYPSLVILFLCCDNKI